MHNFYEKQKEDIKELKKPFFDEVELLDNFFHLSYDEFKKLPKRMRIQVIYSMLDKIYDKCGDALEMLYPSLRKIGNRKYDIYERLLFESFEEEFCLSKILSLIKNYRFRNKFPLNKEKLRRVILFLKNGKIKNFEELYKFLPRELFVKLKTFDKIKGELNFKSDEDAWAWFLEKQMEIEEIYEQP